MSIYNRRNAMMGWATWIVAKRILKKKAREAVPGTIDGTKRPNRSAILSLLAVAGGVLWFWYSRGDDEPPAT